MALQQQEHFKKSEAISVYCRTRKIAETLVVLDEIYGHTPLNTPLEIRRYVDTHPKILVFRSKPEMRCLSRHQLPVNDLSKTGTDLFSIK